MPKSSFAVKEAWPAVAIGAGVYVAVTAVKKILPSSSDGMTDEQRAARAQTNGGAPVDAPGQRLLGESDYAKVYKGQKVDGLKRFGESQQSHNNHAYPVTPRAFATQVVTYWMTDISRLVGFDSSSTLNAIFGEDKPLSLTDFSRRSPASIYNGIVSKDSADAMLADWNRLQPDIVTELHGGDPLSAEGTIRFWDYINALMIGVDVDRAVPSSAGMVWASIYEAAQEAPGLLGDAVEKVTKEATGALWQVFGAAALNILFSPLGLAAAGMAVWLYRGELAAFARRF